MAKKYTVLAVDDDQRHREMLATLLDGWGYRVVLAEDGRKAVEICSRKANSRDYPDLVLMDVRMPGLSGLDAMREIHRQNPVLPIIMMTAYSEIPAAVEAIRSGAYDYLTKPLDFTGLCTTLEDAFVQLESGRSSPEGESRQIAEKSRLLGESAAMRELDKLIQTIAPSEATVLIRGESGTGKELAARAVHAASRHANGPFVAINCGALTESLLASELFGHEKGAFTGADKKHDGLFLEAGDGSIFLDEIGEMTPAMQVKLLRVLQEREVLSVGGKKPQPINCRILAATNRDLAEDMKNGAFRQDLYYRLNVVSLTMPPLRERTEDIPMLAREFANRFAAINKRKFSGISAGALARMMEYDWPGNVRELENVMERAIILMPGDYIDERELPERIGVRRIKQGAIAPGAPGTPEPVIVEGIYPPADDESPLADTSSGVPTLEEVERQVILRTLDRFGNNKTEAARALGITRKTLHAKLNRYREDNENN